MATDKMRIGDLLQYLSNIDETVDSFMETRLSMQNELECKLKEGNKITDIDIADLISAVENGAFIKGISVGVKLKNILNSM